MKVQAAPSEHYPWLASRTGAAAIPAGFRAIECVDSAGRIRGMCGFEGWTPSAVTMSAAVDAPIAVRALMDPAFEYPFLEADRRLVLASSRSDNPKSLRLMKGLGFRQAHRIVDGWSEGVDLVLFEFRRDDWLAKRGRRRVAA